MQKLQQKLEERKQEEDCGLGQTISITRPA